MFRLSDDEDDTRGKIVFTIRVRGPPKNNGKGFISIVVDLYNNYEVRCKIYPINISCGKYSSYSDAMRVFNNVMKLGMQGRLLYQDCWKCLEQIWFPQMSCKCGEICTTGSWTVIEQIEQRVKNEKNVKYK